MNNNTYFDMADEFESYFPSLSSLAVDWYPSGRNEITVKLNDNRKLAYNSITKSIRYILKYDEDEFISEEAWCKEFGRRLHKKVTERGITYKELSELTNISAVTLSKYAQGKAVPSAYKIKQIANVLECSQSELIDVE